VHGRAAHIIIFTNPYYGHVRHIGKNYGILGLRQSHALNGQDKQGGNEAKFYFHRIKE
jgi:hypothetical protein